MRFRRTTGSGATVFWSAMRPPTENLFMIFYPDKLIFYPNIKPFFSRFCFYWRRDVVFNAVFDLQLHGIDVIYPNGLPVIVNPNVEGPAPGRVEKTDDLLLKFIVQSFFEFCRMKQEMKQETVIASCKLNEGQERYHNKCHYIVATRTICVRSILQ